jgi:hypothetical protein
MLREKSKRTGFAAVRVAVDMVKEQIIDKKEALLRVEADHLNQLLRGDLDLGRVTRRRRALTAHSRRRTISR